MRKSSVNNDVSLETQEDSSSGLLYSRLVAWGFDRKLISAFRDAMVARDRNALKALCPTNMSSTCSCPVCMLLRLEDKFYYKKVRE